MTRNQNAYATVKHPLPGTNRPVTNRISPANVRMPGEPSVGRPIIIANNLVMDYSARRVAPNRSMQPSMGTLTRTAPALDNVSFRLNAGDTVAIMGPSGSGKSTLLHILAGIDLPTSGQVTYYARNNCAYELTHISDQDRTMLRRNAFGFVFQSGQLLPELPAVENIALPLMLGGTDYAQATDIAMLWLERLGLKHLASHRPGEMSGGQMQRVAIARALATNPSVVFADEPTGALDQATGREVMGILMDAARANGSAVVVVTHDPNVAAFCDRTVTMCDGRLLGGER